MTVDQTLTLLAILAWPTVAVIAGVAFVHGVRLLVDAAVDHSSRMALVRADSDTKWRNLVSAMVQSTLPATMRAVIDSAKPTEASTAERALLTVLAAVGGIPGEREDEAVRQLVREVRKMYSELAHPTPEPALRKRARDPEEEFLDEVFGIQDSDDGAGSGDGKHAEFIETEDAL